MERMIQLYDGLGKKDKAEEWQRKVQAEQKQGR